MKVSQHPEGLMELPEEELEVIKKHAEKFEFDQLNHLFNLLIKGEEEIAQSAFPRTMLEMTLIRMSTLRPILPIDEILKKLENLEKKHPSVGTTEQMKFSPSGRAISSKEPKLGGGVAEEPKILQEENQKDKGLGEKKTLGKVGEEEAAPSMGGVMNAEDPMAELVGGGVSSKVGEETWRGLVDFTRARNPILGSFLAMGNLVYVSDEKIEIGFEKDSFHYERILEKENRSQLESICHEFLKRKAKVIISASDQRMVSKGRMVSEAGEPPRNEFEKPFSKKGEENPLIQEALRLFDGKIVER
jgi:DNA polymerase-3 subunit gamma/tau